MQKPDKPRSTPRSAGAAVECCTELTCESGLRNHYYEGKRLTPDMFRVEQRYLNERRRLLNRAIHGYGVVYGYAMDVRQSKGGRREQASTRLAIADGLALDRCGRELLHVAREVAMNDLIPLDDKGRRIDLDELLPPRDEKPDERTCWIVSAHYAEQRFGAIPVKDPCSCDRDEWDHVCETVRFSLRRVPCAECCSGCDCELTCNCAGGKCCCDEKDDMRRAADAAKPETHPPYKRGGCRCLCDHLTGLEFPDCGARLCEIEEACATLWVDISQGVPLACIQLEPDDCGGWTIAGLDACGPRPLVKRNDVLFDLLRGCDLTVIADFGWKPWHRQLGTIGFEAFANGFGPDGKRQHEYITDKFWVKFSRPVRKDTLDADCFSFTVLSVEREGKWRGVQRVPISRLEYIHGDKGDPDDTVRGAYLVVEGGWVEDALWGRGSVFYDDSWAEIEVRGDFILDCNGQPVDANAVGRAKSRTGNGTPGGTFLSTFQIGPRPPYARRPTDTAQPPAEGAAS